MNRFKGKCRIAMTCQQVSSLFNKPRYIFQVILILVLVLNSGNKQLLACFVFCRLSELHWLITRQWFGVFTADEHHTPQDVEINVDSSVALLGYLLYILHDNSFCVRGCPFPNNFCTFLCLLSIKMYRNY